MSAIARRLAIVIGCFAFMGASPLSAGQVRYIGAVRTIHANYALGYNEYGAVAYDTKRNSFYVPSANYNNIFIFRIAANGLTSAFAIVPWMPTALAYNPVDDKLYYTDYWHYQVFSIDQHGLVLVLAGSGTQGTQDGKGQSAQFQQPQGITVDPKTGDLFVADLDRVRRITRGGVVTTVSPPGGFGGGFSFGLFYPEGIAYSPITHTLFVSDPFQQKIWHIAAHTAKYVSGQCINYCQPYQRDGALSFALFGYPTGAVFDPTTKSLYVSDLANNQVRRVNDKGVTTIAGAGLAGSSDGVGIHATFSSPGEGTFDTKTGEIVVLDKGANALRAVTPAGPTPPPPAHAITLYDPPTAASAPSSIAVGTDGSVWFVESAVGQFGRRMPDGTFHEYAAPPSTYSIGRIILGGDGNMWFARVGGATLEVDRINPDGSYSEFQTGFQRSAPVDIVLGSDGNIWFSDQWDGSGFVTPSGTVTTFPGVTGDFIATGLANSYWLSLSNLVKQIDTSGHTLRQISLPLSPGNMILGPGNNMWLGQPGVMARISAKSLVEYVLPYSHLGSARNVGDIVVGADHGLWFWENDPWIARMSVGGTLRDYLVPAPRSAPSGIAAAPDGSIWFADPGANKIGQYK